MEKLDGKSLDIREDSIEKLKQLFPEIITEGEQINFEKLKSILTDDLDESNEKYTFTWNGKSESMRIANTPTTGTLKPMIDKSKDWDNTENIYIEGDNLEVLKLLQKSYSNKIRIVYIDPPYNTGNDFVYNDNYKDNMQNYLNKTEQVNEKGYKQSTNTETSGRYHSDWLNMMYPRLKLARNLLASNGVVFISIDDNEQGNLKKMCDEIFGSVNFVGQVVRISKTTSFRGQYFAPSKDYVIVYAKNINYLEKFSAPIENTEQFSKIETSGDRKGEYYRDDIAFYLSTLQTRPNQRYFIECPDGELVVPPGNTLPTKKEDGYKAIPEENDGVWRWSQEQYLIKKDLLSFKKTKTSPLLNQDGEQAKWNIYTKSYLKDKQKKGNIPRDIFSKFLNRNGSEELKRLEIPFSFPKPVELIKYLIEIANTTDQDSIILDFFSGSATTAQAVMEKNAEDGRNLKHIMVQLPEQIEKKSPAYSQGYRSIPDIAVERINRAGDKIIKENPELENELDIGFKYFKLDKSNIKKWNIDEENLKEDLLLFTDNFEEGSTHDDIVYELLLKQGIELTVPINKETFEETSIYVIANGAMFVVIGNNIDESIGEYIRDYESIFNQDEDSEIVVAFQDIGFEDDSAKLNTFEILKAAGFKDENIFTI